MAGLIMEAAKPKSDQLNSDDLIGIDSIIIKVISVEVRLGKDQPVTVNAEHLDGRKMLPFKPCKNMMRCMAQGWGDDEKIYAGKYLKLFRDPKVTWAGQEVGGLRIKAMSNIKHSFKFIYRKARGAMEPMQIDRLDPSELGAVKPIDPAVKAAGDAAAAGGVKSYTEWKDGLTPEVKETIKPYHPDWAKTAKEADQPKEQQPAATDTPPI